LEVSGLAPWALTASELSPLSFVTVTVAVSVGSLMLGVTVTVIEFALVICGFVQLGQATLPLGTLTLTCELEQNPIPLMVIV
jgi:hypothetical protein